MAKKEILNKVPKKYRNLKRSFVDNIALGNNQSFMSFPKGLHFHGKEQGEEIILIIRSHWIMYVPYALSAILILILPFVLSGIIPSITKNLPLFFALIVTAFVLAMAIVVNAFVKWFYNVNMITDQRVIDLDYASVMSHTLSEAQLEKIEDVSHKQLGILGSFFDVGSVYIQTAGTSQNIEFVNIPRPRDVQDILIDMLESKQEGEI